jgi:hypothetical protein
MKGDTKPPILHGQHTNTDAGHSHHQTKEVPCFNIAHAHNHRPCDTAAMVVAPDHSITRVLTTEPHMTNSITQRTSTRLSLETSH